MGLAVLAAIASPLAAAEDSGWVFGVNAGQSRVRIDDARIIDQLALSGLSTETMSDTNRDRAFKLFAGYKFNQNFALEGGYFDLGNFAYTAYTAPAGFQTGAIKLRGLNFDAVGMLPLANKFSAFAKVGLIYSEAQDTFASGGAVPRPSFPNPNENSVNAKLGLGVQYDLTESVSLRGEYERYRINDAVGSRGDVDLLSAGLVVTLGQKKQPAAVAQKLSPPPPPPPAPIVAEQVVPQPLMVIVPMLVKTRQYCSILDIQFEIKNDEMQREEKEKLNVLGTFMKKYPDTTAVIEGHSDDIGTEEFNLKLSQRRAESVVSYLRSNFKIESARLTSIGYGKSRPVADNSTKEGQQANRRINAVVACATDIEGLKVAPARLTMALEIDFDPLKADIAPEYNDELAKVANFMKENPSVTATVEGHAGKFVGLGKERKVIRADQAMNISEKRAQNVVNYLVDKLGVARSRLATAQFGQTRRVAYGITLEGQQENRRVNIIFNYAK